MKLLTSSVKRKKGTTGLEVILQGSDGNSFPTSPMDKGFNISDFIVLWEIQYRCNNDKNVIVKY